MVHISHGIHQSNSISCFGNGHKSSDCHPLGMTNPVSRSTPAVDSLSRPKRPQQADEPEHTPTSKARAPNSAGDSVAWISWDFPQKGHVPRSSESNFLSSWLVVWNHGIVWLSRNSWEFYDPSWRTHIFRRGGSTTNCIGSFFLPTSIGRFPLHVHGFSTQVGWCMPTL